jgi:hypothetical protein
MERPGLFMMQHLFRLGRDLPPDCVLHVTDRVLYIFFESTCTP